MSAVVGDIWMILPNITILWRPLVFFIIIIILPVLGGQSNILLSCYTPINYPLYPLFSHYTSTIPLNCMFYRTLWWLGGPKWQFIQLIARNKYNEKFSLLWKSSKKITCLINSKNSSQILNIYWQCNSVFSFFWMVTSLKLRRRLVVLSFSTYCDVSSFNYLVSIFF